MDQEPNAVIDQLAEQVVQLLWPKMAGKYDAQTELFTDRLNDLGTRVALLSDLLETLHQQVSDCQAELQAARDEGDRSRHDQVEAFSAMRSYRDLADRRQERIKKLNETVTRLQQRIGELEHGDD